MVLGQAVSASYIAAMPKDDIVAPFSLDNAPVRGRIVRLGAAALDPILRRHDYPPPVAMLLGETLCLATLVGSLLKAEGRFRMGGHTLDANERIIGSAMVVEFASREECDAWVAAEPYVVQKVWREFSVVRINLG